MQLSQIDFEKGASSLEIFSFKSRIQITWSALHCVKIFLEEWSLVKNLQDLKHITNSIEMQEIDCKNKPTKLYQQSH